MLSRRPQLVLLKAPVCRPTSGHCTTASAHLQGYVQQRCGRAERCDRQRESTGRHSHGKTYKRWDYRSTDRGCRSLESDQAVRPPADVRSAVVRTSSGYIGAVDNPNSSIPVVAVLGVASIASPAATTMPPTAGPITRHAPIRSASEPSRAVRRPSPPSNQMPGHPQSPR